MLTAAGFAVLVPVGEAPDEQAHLAYVDHLVEHGSLPPLPETPGLLDYQAYQPPLDYAASALKLKLIHGGPVHYPFRLDPGLEDGTSHRRFLPEPPEAAGFGDAVRALRLTRLLWAGLTALLLLAAAAAAVPEQPRVALIGALPFALSPQFLFISGSVNNDALLAVLCALTLVGCLRLVSVVPRASPTPLAWGVGTAAGLALWAKVSGLVLAPCLLLTAALLVRRRRPRSALGLLAPAALLAAAWVAMSMVRFGASIPPPPSGFEEPLRPLAVLLTAPWWLVRLWGSFWGSFGWVSVQLPRPVYLAFLPASGLLLWGAWTALRQLAVPSPGRSRDLPALALAVSTFLFVLVYMVGIDWQPQGRYLFPGLAACSYLAARGLGDLAAHLAPFERLATTPWGPAGALAFTFGLALFSLAVVAAAYGA